MRSSVKTLIFAPALVLAAACSKDKPADATLSNDLTLAAQARQTATLDSITAAERTKAAVAAAAPVAAAPALRASAPARTSTARRRTASSGTRSSGSDGGTYSTRERGTITEKNTKRDAAIGAAAGAIIGGASTHSVKGGIIGAAAGGILGGIIGNNVDIKKKPAP